MCFCICNSCHHRWSDDSKSPNCPRCYSELVSIVSAQNSANHCVDCGAVFGANHNVCTQCNSVNVESFEILVSPPIPSEVPTLKELPDCAQTKYINDGSLKCICCDTPAPYAECEDPKKFLCYGCSKIWGHK